jgi:hypothetical protein
LLHKTSSIVAQLACPEQVYVCLWSHGPAHIHFVVQPVDHELMERMGGHGPRLQVAMFDSEPAPDEAAVSAFAAAARDKFRGA